MTPISFNEHGDYGQKRVQNGKPESCWAIIARVTTTKGPRIGGEISCFHVIGPFVEGILVLFEEGSRPSVSPSSCNPTKQTGGKKCDNPKEALSTYFRYEQQFQFPIRLEWRL